METRAWKDDKISPTIHTNSGKIKILENQNLKSKLCNQLVASGQVQEGDVIRHSYSSSRMNNFYPSNRENKEISDTLQTQPKEGVVYADYRIRKLTPKECMRLMGFDDKDYEAMRAIGMSDTAIYHCAGDSIVVNVLVEIFRGMFKKDNNN